MKLKSHVKSKSHRKSNSHEGSQRVTRVNYSPWLYMLEIILRGGVNQYYQINNLIFQTNFYTLLQISELACMHDCT